MKTRIILAAALLLAGAARVQAQGLPRQDADDAVQTPESDKTCAVCFRGGQRPACASFLITEFSVLYRLAGGNSAEDQSPFAYGAELGGMVNIGRTSAVGATGFVSLDGMHGRFGVKTRYRRWLSNRFASDVGFGVVLANQNQAKGAWLTESIGLTLNDRLHLTLEHMHGQVRNHGDPSRVSKLYAGVKIGGVAGGSAVAVAAVATAVFVAIAISNLHDFSIGSS